MRWFAILLGSLIVVAVAGAKEAPLVCARGDGTVVVRAPERVRVAAVFVAGKRRGKVRRGHPRAVTVPAGRTVTVKVRGRTRSGRRVIALLRARRCAGQATPTPTQTPAGPGFVTPDDPRLRYEGRWDVSRARAVTVNSGARIFLRFSGTEVTGDFDVSQITREARLYAWVDGRRSAVIHVNATRVRLTPADLDDGQHTLVLATKDVSQDANRWEPPLRSAFKLNGFELGTGTLGEPLPGSPLRFTFLGDSITQGTGDRCLVESDGVTSPSPTTPQSSDCTDATIDYAWRTARVFGAQLEQVGFAGQGLTRGGSGNVPPAPQTVGSTFDGVPAAPFDAQVVVINYGTNDVLNNAAPSQIRSQYLALLRKVRARYPDARIIALEIFGAGGAETVTATTAIQGAVSDFGDDRTTFVTTRSWLNPATDFSDQIHPNESGHRHVTERLAARIAQLTGLLPLAPMDAAPAS